MHIVSSREGLDSRPRAIYFAGEELREIIARATIDIKLAFFWGSFAKGEVSPLSDIDIVLVAEPFKAQRVAVLTRELLRFCGSRGVSLDCMTVFLGLPFKRDDVLKLHAAKGYLEKNTNSFIAGDRALFPFIPVISESEKVAAVIDYAVHKLRASLLCEAMSQQEKLEELGKVVSSVKHLSLKICQIGRKERVPPPLKESFGIYEKMVLAYTDSLSVEVPSCVFDRELERLLVDAPRMVSHIMASCITWLYEESL